MKPTIFGLLSALLCFSSLAHDAVASDSEPKGADSDQWAISGEGLTVYYSALGTSYDGVLGDRNTFRSAGGSRRFSVTFYNPDRGFHRADRFDPDAAVAWRRDGETRWLPAPHERVTGSVVSVFVPQSAFTTKRDTVLEFRITMSGSDGYEIRSATQVVYHRFTIPREAVLKQFFPCLRKADAHAGNS